MSLPFIKEGILKGIRAESKQILTLQLLQRFLKWLLPRTKTPTNKRNCNILLYRLTSFGPNTDLWGTPRLADLQKIKNVFKVLPLVIYESLKANIHSPFCYFALHQHLRETWFHLISLLNAECSPARHWSCISAIWAFLAVDICLLLLLENKTDERVNVKIRKPKDAPRHAHIRLTCCSPKYTSLHNLK